MNWEIIEEKSSRAKIKVIGVGGAGGNAVMHMIEHDIQGPDFICANTDSQALDKAKGATILKLGDNLTKRFRSRCQSRNWKTSSRKR